MDINDAIVLKVDLPEENLEKKIIGAIVEIFNIPDQAYEVEFTNQYG